MRRKKKTEYFVFSKECRIFAASNNKFETIYRGVEQWQLVGLITQRS